MQIIRTVIKSVKVFEMDFAIFCIVKIKASSIPHSEVNLKGPVLDKSSLVIWKQQVNLENTAEDIWQV